VDIFLFEKMSDETTAAIAGLCRLAGVRWRVAGGVGVFPFPVWISCHFALRWDALSLAGGFPHGKQNPVIVTHYV
jgi:hypothetical protein